MLIITCTVNANDEYWSDSMAKRNVYYGMVNCVDETG